ncbi:hypothetical protein CDAR_438001 [Caerostris darwini]|uniref:Uncharacterized protein n=1 Tax=Caerostris darwini TaxID=1538125 RepID=A0AAV4TXN4_9ARAC|nr:hypothetical protein CDAR_438001 [Caerostris darwini]
MILTVTAPEDRSAGFPDGSSGDGPSITFSARSPSLCHNNRNSALKKQAPFLLTEPFSTNDNQMLPSIPRVTL